MLVILSAALTSGCSKYQFISMASHLPQGDNKEFVYENDTALIKYTFPGENLYLTLTIYNKTNQPLYIDIDRSTIVVNNYQVSDPFYHEGMINFIAPLSNAVITSNPLKDKFFNLSKKDSLSGEIQKVHGEIVHRFNETTTPFNFRVILALTPRDDYSFPTFYDYSFWADGIVQTITPGPSMKLGPANQSFIRKPTTFSGIAGSAGLVILLVIVGMFGG